jgi:hypothetical protein
MSAEPNPEPKKNEVRCRVCKERTILAQKIINVRTGGDHGQQFVSF